MLEIYADVVFLINFFMDLLIFYITSKLLKKKIKILRLMLGSLFTALAYCLFIFIGFLNPFMNIFSPFLIILSGAFIVFPFSSVKGLFKTVLMCYIVSFATGGAAMVLFYYFNITDILGTMIGISTTDISIKILIAASASSFIIYKLIFYIYRRFFSMPKSFLELVISFNGKNSVVHTLVDTGNELVDPITKSPVIVVEFEAIKNLLSDKTKEIFLNNLEDNLPEILNRVCDSELSRTIRMIPYKSLGQQNGMLIGFRPDGVHIPETDTEKNDFIIAVYNGKLGDEYNALCPHIHQNF